ncbi:uncharacterized protein LOC135471870 [Liolophura sinensis]|uniref:uncharacterized protein LOC135471870 n=1 Tax=Liolophura sinensis TaxID=3198878 RepID=UPI003158CEA9
MSGAVQDGEFTEPAYATDEKSKPGFVRTIVAVKGLRSTNQMTMKGLKKKASNAEIESTFEQQSFCLTVEGTKGDVKHKKYQLKIRKLPGEIIPEKCYVEPDKDRVLLFLHKSEDKSWYPELENGLEMEEDQEEDS